MKIAKEGQRDKWKLVALILGILIILVVVGTVIMLAFDSQDSLAQKEIDVEKTELTSAAPSEQELKTSSSITITESETKSTETSEGEDDASGDSHRYEIVSKRLTWSEAKAYCEEQGGYLATVTSQDEYNIIVEAAKASGRKVLWLGALRGSDNNFKWITGETFSYTYWLQNEPNNEGGNENCLVMFLVNDQWVWADVPSDVSPYYGEDKVGFVCEYDE